MSGKPLQQIMTVILLGVLLPVRVIIASHDCWGVLCCAVLPGVCCAVLSCLGCAVPACQKWRHHSSQQGTWEHACRCSQISGRPTWPLKTHMCLDLSTSDLMQGLILNRAYGRTPSFSRPAAQHACVGLCFQTCVRRLEAPSSSKELAWWQAHLQCRDAHLALEGIPVWTQC